MRVLLKKILVRFEVHNKCTFNAIKHASFSDLLKYKLCQPLILFKRKKLWSCS